MRRQVMCPYPSNIMYDSQLKQMEELTSIVSMQNIIILNVYNNIVIKSKESVTLFVE